MDQCPGCGLAIDGGEAACQALFERLLAREYSDYRFARFHRTTVDAYAMQHPERYGASAKSFLAHLCGLACAFVHENEPQAYAALQRSLNGAVAAARPSPPAERGSRTIASVIDCDDPVRYGELVRSWARAVWDAYAPLHGVAEEWMRRGAFPLDRIHK